MEKSFSGPQNLRNISKGTTTLLSGVLFTPRVHISLEGVVEILILNQFSSKKKRNQAKAARASSWAKGIVMGIGHMIQANASTVAAYRSEIERQNSFCNLL